jgi:ubiquinone/menaquinone biosynthesis C-methylase UbiE
MPYDAHAVKEAYNRSAAGEDKFEKGFSLRNEIPRAFIRKYIKPSDAVLDAGGGTAANAILMAQICSHVTLVDVSPRVLDYARLNIEAARLAHKIDVIEADISDLGRFKDESFNLVVCVGGAISYLKEKAVDALGELVRVATAGSTLLVGCDSTYGLARWLANETESEGSLDAAIEVLRRGEYEAADGVFAKLYTPSELTQLVKSMGCEIVEVASTPILFDTWDQSSYPEEDRGRLKQLELELCVKPELVGMGHHLLCVATKP